MDVETECEPEDPSPSPAAEGDKEEQWRGPRPRDHPKYTEMMALDIADSTQVYTAFLVFLDLLEARNWKDVIYKGSEELQLIYLQGCPGEQEEMELVVPMPIHMTLSHERFNHQNHSGSMLINMHQLEKTAEDSTNYGVCL
ncbi:tRNA-splicing endonuclease subunit Sen15 isoform X2 [Chiloscyllium punctatum]|uniref:tRNA-splicing endonuclease subunit Sen15 isoform X2 n=1 Tax=Chiloscyllium punctatum TaxID=137246 RepID=UPI003B64089D